MVTIIPYFAPALALNVDALTVRKLNSSFVPSTGTVELSRFSPGKTSFPIMRVNDIEPIRYPKVQRINDSNRFMYALIS
jgi:hypothetical protein